MRTVRTVQTVLRVRAVRALRALRAVRLVRAVHVGQLARRVEFVWRVGWAVRGMRVVMVEPLQYSSSLSSSWQQH